MARPSWLVDGKRIATKIKSASSSCEPHRVTWKSNPSIQCSNCHHVIDNNDVVQEWPGFPRGVKFDPTDQDIIWHLLTKVGVESYKPHPWIDEFIPTVKEEDGICYTHPQNLPGVKKDGEAAHFFHRAIKAYNTGTRKRRKIKDDDVGDVRWHKTGRTKPVMLNGVQRGCKKIMVLYGGKTSKTNWVMHQYHLGTEEEEKDGEYVVSKVFYQQQAKQGDKIEPESTATTPKVDPVTPKSITPEPPCQERRSSVFDMEQNTLDEHAFILNEYLETGPTEDGVQANTGPRTDEVQPEVEMLVFIDETNLENHAIEVAEDNIEANQMVEDNSDTNAEEDPKWWDSGSQYLLNSQQLVEGLSLCDDLLQSQSPSREEDKNDGNLRRAPSLSFYAHLSKEDFKRDLEECRNLAMDPANIELDTPQDFRNDLECCQTLVMDPANIDLDTPPEFRLSQLEFGSQDSFIAWGGSKVNN